VSVASATPRSPVVDQGPAVDQGQGAQVHDTQLVNVVHLKAVSVSVGSPVIGIPRSGTDSVKPKLATVDGRAVHDRETGTKGQHTKRSHGNGASQRKRSRGAGRPITTPIPMDWLPSEKDRAWATGKGYTDEAIDRMATAFLAHYVGRGTPGANRSAMWMSWVLRGAKLPNGERPVERSVDPNGTFAKPAGLQWEDRGHGEKDGWVYEGLPADRVYWLDGRKMPKGWQPTAGAVNGED
jgi:hypothetical protein